MSVELPIYLDDEQDDSLIRDRLLARIPTTFDRSQGSFFWDILAAAAVELAQAALWGQQVLARGFAQTSFGSYLDLRAEEHGVFRKPAVAATGIVTFRRSSGTTGAVTIPQYTKISTASTRTTPAVVFRTTVAAEIAVGEETVDVPVAAVEAGASGNVGATAIQFLVDGVDDVGAVSNAAATSGGAAEEADADFLDRYLQFVRNPGTSGNKADYYNWALAVAGVGDASVVPVKYGPGTVSVAIVDADKQPVGLSLVDTVQDAIAPPWRHDYAAEDLPTYGHGVSLATGLGDDNGDSLDFAADPAGRGALGQQAFQAVLDRKGRWRVRLLVKVNDNAGLTDLVTVGVWNRAKLAAPTWADLERFGWTWAEFDAKGLTWDDWDHYGGWADLDVSDTTDALSTFPAADLGEAFGYLDQQFYWNGEDPLDLVVCRLETDPTTHLYLDSVRYQSAFSKDLGEGLAPIGAAVYVESAEGVTIDVSANLVLDEGYSASQVRSAVKAAILAYLKDLTFETDNNVRWTRVANLILGVSGVSDYTDFAINGAAANVAIDEQQVAVLGTVTLDGVTV